MVGPVVTRIVVPSGPAPLTDLIPISPSPPVRFSTITLRSSSGPRCWPTSRQSASPPPPAANGKTIFQRPGLRERIAGSCNQRPSDASGQKMTAIHFDFPPTRFCPLQQTATALKVCLPTSAASNTGRLHRRSSCCKTASFNERSLREEEIMIGYVTFGTNDLKKAADSTTRSPPKWASGASWNPTRSSPGERRAAAPGRPDPPFDGKPMTVGNGVMVALAPRTRRRSTASTSSRCRSAAPTRALPARAARGILRRLFPGSRRQQAQRLRDGLIATSFDFPRPAPLPNHGGGAYCFRNPLHSTTTHDQPPALKNFRRSSSRSARRC